MRFQDLRDPDCKVYVICAMISVAVILATTATSFAYLIVMAPSEGHTLNEGEDPVGLAQPLVCAAIYIACLALLIRDMRKRMRAGTEDDRDSRFMRAPLSKAGMLFAITAFTSLAVIVVSFLIGEEITQSFLDDYSSYSIMASMLCAGPEEEIITRVLLIGVPMALICALTRRGSAKVVLGGFGMSWTAMVLLVISSVVFGLMHLGGWSIMKFPDTFISGMLFGYVYIQYGAHASIVMHSSFDLLASFDYLVENSGTACMIFLAAVGAVLLLRSLLKIRSYIPDRILHEPFEGGALAMWERDRLR